MKKNKPILDRELDIVVSDMKLRRYMGCGNVCPSCGERGYFGSVCKYESEKGGWWIICGWCGEVNKDIEVKDGSKE